MTRFPGIAESNSTQNGRIPCILFRFLSFNIVGMHSEEAGRRLNQRGIAVRAGLHCAPSAHRLMGTLEQGAGPDLSFRVYYKRRNTALYSSGVADCRTAGKSP